MEQNTGGHPVHSAKILTIQQGVSSIGNPRQALHSTKEIIVMMWIFHIERHALEVPHRIDSFYSILFTRVLYK